VTRLRQETARSYIHAVKERWKNSRPRNYYHGGFATVNNLQPSPPCSLITVRASLSSRNPANLLKDG